MQQKRAVNKKPVAIGLIVLLVIVIIVVLTFLNRSRSYYPGIHVEFDPDASTEYEQTVIEQYHADDVFMDNPHYYHLTFFHKSEREIIKLASKLQEEECVLKAYYVRVLSFS